MKCVHCDRDTRYSDRKEGKCPGCGRAFAFEPQKGDKLTDGAFRAALDRVSSFGSVKWTRQNLYYDVARRLGRRGRALPWLFGIVAIVSAAFALVSGWALVATLFLVMLTIQTLPQKHVRLSKDDFDAMFNKWIVAHGQPTGLIVRRPAATAPRTREVPADIHHYSFDRAVVSDRADTVDVLLANNFHFENNCAVLSADGYPEEAFETVRGMLRQNPKLTVYVLHDATVAGCLLAAGLRKRGWFADSARIIDVGLHPDQAKRFAGSFRPGASFSVDTKHLSPRDAAWLQLHSLELAVIRPEQVVKRLFRALSNEGPLIVAPGGGYEIDTTSFGTVATTSDGGGDSFG